MQYNHIHNTHREGQCKICVKETKYETLRDKQSPEMQYLGYDNHQKAAMKVRPSLKKRNKYCQITENNRYDVFYISQLLNCVWH